MFWFYQKKNTSYKKTGHIYDLSLMVEEVLRDLFFSRYFFDFSHTFFSQIYIVDDGKDNSYQSQCLNH